MYVLKGWRRTYDGENKRPYRAVFDNVDDMNRHILDKIKTSKMSTFHYEIYPVIMLPHEIEYKPALKVKKQGDKGLT